MMNLNKILGSSCLLLAFWLWWVIDDYTHLQAHTEQLTALTKQQAAALSQQKKQFNQSQQLSLAIAQTQLSVEAQAQEKLIEYHTIFKKEPACHSLVPQSITDGLLNYSQQLRTSTLRNSTDHTHPTAISSFTDYSLTYCQAVEWLLPLLMTIDKANRQLEAIQQITHADLTKTPH